MQGLNRIALLAVWLLCLFFNGAFSERVNLEAAQKVFAGDDTPEEVEMICHPGKECYPKYFVPTDTFRYVEIDQVIPAGLHVRLNVGTGGREAKLIDPNEDEGTAVYVEKEKKQEISPPTMEFSDLVIVDDPDVDESSVFSGGQSNSTDDETPNVHVVPEPETYKPNPHLSLSDWESFNNAVAVINGINENNKNEDVADLDEALQALSDLSHEPEYGVKLVETSLRRLVFLVSSTEYSPTLRSLAAITLGNSLQNNGAAQAKAGKLLGASVREAVLKPILNSLVESKDGIIRRRIMYALSRTVQIPFGKQHFIFLNGLKALAKVFAETKDLPLRGKIAAFIQDEVFGDRSEYEAVIERDGRAKPGRHTFKIRDHLDVSEWCGILQDDLLSRDETEGGVDLDSKAKVVSAYAKLRYHRGSKCQVNEGMDAWLRTESEKHKYDGDWISVPLEDALEYLYY